MFFTTFLLIVVTCYHCGFCASKRSFVIDYDNNQFLKDDQPFQYISGSIHYFRVPRIYWLDRLKKMKAAGLNAIETYIPWNYHEKFYQDYNFEGDADLPKFLSLANSVGLVVILRVGPYSCGEWENGGFPYYLLNVPDIKLRTSDPRFLQHVERWYGVLLPRLVPYLYRNGGPVVMAQVENEYGSFHACDRNYTIFLRDVIRSHLGNETVLFTVDGGAVSYLKCGVVPDVFATVDFGTDSRAGVAGHFQAQRQYQPKGPLVNTEFYPGWLDVWGDTWSVVNTDDVVLTMAYMYQLNASFNFYMFHGGTNFGYWAGGMGGSPYQSVTTSYDYDAPLSEAGDPTDSKFAHIRTAIEVITGKAVAGPIPPATKKSAYGPVRLQFFGFVTDMLDVLCTTENRISTLYPLSYEQIHFPYGYVLYEAKLTVAGTNLSIPEPHDRGYVTLDRDSVGTLIRDHVTSLKVNAKPGQTLRILIENMGRKCNGENDYKGIISNVTIDGNLVTGWTIYPLDLESVSKSFQLKVSAAKSAKSLTTPKQREAFGAITKLIGYHPGIYYGTFAAPVISDTFFDTTGWGKGQLFINGFNVGRYWPSLGPQVTLYVPKSFLRLSNTVMLLEVEQPGNCEDTSMYFCKGSFTDTPHLNKTVKGAKQERRGTGHEIKF